MAKRGKQAKTRGRKAAKKKASRKGIDPQKDRNVIRLKQNGCLQPEYLSNATLIKIAQLDDEQISALINVNKVVKLEAFFKAGPPQQDSA